MVDSVFSESKVKIIEELQTKYETEKKDLQIANLAQQASIKDLEIKQKNQALVVGLFAVLFIAGFIYLMYRQRALKRNQKQTALEQRFLRSQLNPHFMSNALMAIQNFMLKNQSDKAATYLAKFAKLMREILENSRKEFILVEDEIQMLTNYLDIHRARMNESFNYTIEVDENIDRETDAIPPMFVQPFIENAIEHGIMNAKAQGMIKLKLVKDGDYIAIEITDNGGGMIQRKQELKEHTSLSTTIIQERIALLNKSLKRKIELGWENILNDRGEVNGTKVELKVPYNYL
jgi:LytS/YehU family sensor histidine kinase